MKINKLKLIPVFCFVISLCVETQCAEKTDEKERKENSTINSSLLLTAAVFTPLAGETAVEAAKEYAKDTVCNNSTYCDGSGGYLVKAAVGVATGAALWHGYNYYYGKNGEEKK